MKTNVLKKVYRTVTMIGIWTVFMGKGGHCVVQTANSNSFSDVFYWIILGTTLLAFYAGHQLTHSQNYIRS